MFSVVGLYVYGHMNFCICVVGCIAVFSLTLFRSRHSRGLRILYVSHDNRLYLMSDVITRCQCGCRTAMYTAVHIRVCTVGVPRCTLPYI